jgi:hypothetical protein
MSERQLSAEETRVLYDRITNDSIRPFQKVVEDKCGELYYDFEHTMYRLIFTPDFNDFLDIAFEGDY